MPDRPILFSGPMVRALLDGRKTQTRRVLKPQPSPSLPIGGADFVQMEGAAGSWCWLNGFDGSILAPLSVPFQPQGRLWVREAGDLLSEAIDPGPYSTTDEWCVAGWRHAADGHLTSSRDHYTPLWEWVGDCSSDRRPSIHMPRWASRLALTVTDVRVQRVQEISEADAMAEGANGGCRECGEEAPCGCPKPSPDHRDGFAFLWNTLNAKRGFGWDVNPWVCALTFTVHRCNIDQMEAAHV